MTGGVADDMQLVGMVGRVVGVIDVWLVTWLVHGLL